MDVDYRKEFEAAVKHHDSLIDELVLANEVGDPATYRTWLSDSLEIAARRIASRRAMLRFFDPAFVKQWDEDQANRDAEMAHCLADVSP